MRPKYHLCAPANWINDPNGFIYYQGNYHLFYQHFPYENRWGTMHWRHAISKDLINWQDLGIALYPTKDYDANGCFSGSSIEVDGKMYLYYTSVKYTKFNPENVHTTLTGDEFLSSQSMLISEDGFTFDNLNNKKMIIPVFKDGEIGHPVHTRDPKVWKHGDYYYIVLCSKYLDENNNYNGQLLFYRSLDGLNWEYLNNYRGIKYGDMWECPDIFEVNDQYILIMSPERTNQEGYPSHGRITTINFDHQNCDLEITGDLNYLDLGLDLYAPQTAVDQEGRRIYVAWMRMPEADEENWIGLITYPRVITYRNNHIYTNIHPNVDNFFTTKTAAFDPLKPCKITASLKSGDYLNIGGYQISFDSKLTVDRSLVYPDGGGLKKLSSPKLDQCDLKIFYDQHIIEIYINNGEYVLSNIVYNLQDTLTSNINYDIFVK
ncbi:glycoside hydrolase family 32 protein [Thomasclavelia sp.]|uniref:glycoside hydrolase family 32 protein n=1 Tax=Thomasclavelia sp. TaxID=3025757 RepID=UPI0025D6BFBB|nr:glycoside hydrolase family 32 protein [Thomasclavelia sp.]